jgi:hypothetical protein
MTRNAPIAPRVVRALARAREKNLGYSPWGYGAPLLSSLTSAAEGDRECRGTPRQRVIYFPSDGAGYAVHHLDPDTRSLPAGLRRAPGSCGMAGKGESSVPGV